MCTNYIEVAVSGIRTIERHALQDNLVAFASNLGREFSWIPIRSSFLWSSCHSNHKAIFVSQANLDCFLL